MPHVEHDGFTAKQTCCPNPTNSPFTSDLANGEKQKKKMAKKGGRAAEWSMGDLGYVAASDTAILCAS